MGIRHHLFILQAPLTIAKAGTNVVLTWTNSAFGMQTAPAVTGTYTNIPGSFGTVSNQSYIVQPNDDLASTNWISDTNFTGNGSLMQMDAPITNVPQWFFRVRQP